MAMGSNIRPELGRFDYTQFLQGSMAGSQAMGQGLQTLGAGAGKFLEDRADARKATKAGTTKIENFMKLFPENQQVQNMGKSLLAKIEDAKLSDAAAMAGQADNMISTFMDKTMMDMRKGMFDREMKFAEDQLAATTGTAKANLLMRGQEQERLKAESDWRIEKGRAMMPLEMDALRGQIEAGELASDSQIAQAAAGAVMGRALNVANSPEEFGDAVRWGIKRVGKELNLNERQEMLMGGAAYGALSTWQLEQLESSGTMPPAMKKAQEVMGTDAGTWASTGKATHQANLAKLRDAIERHKKVGTGPVKGRMAGYIGPQVVSGSMRERAAIERDIHSVGMQSLKAVLGAQFAQREAENFLRTVYALGDTTETNTNRLELFIKSLENRALVNDRMVDDINQFGVVSPEAARGLKDWQYSLEGTDGSGGKWNMFDTLQEGFDEAGRIRPEAIDQFGSKKNR